MCGVCVGGALKIILQKFAQLTTSTSPPLSIFVFVLFSFQPAKLKEGKDQRNGHAWAWTLWEADVVPPADAGKWVSEKENAESPGQNPLKGGQGRWLQLCVKAVDESFNTQPETPAPIWNLRGILNNSWDRVNIFVTNSEDEDTVDDE